MRGPKNKPQVGPGIDPITLVRVSTVAASRRFQNEVELADAVLEFVSEVGKDLLDSGSLNEQETRGVQGALRDTPIAFAALTCFPLPDEQKANLVFMLANLINDMFSLGVTAMTAGNENLTSRVRKGAIEGGLLSTAKRRKQQKELQGHALEAAEELLKKNARLTQNDLETKLRDRWQSSWPRLPGRNPVIAFISKAQNDGKLPKRTR